MELAIAVAAAVLLGAVGLAFGRSSGRGAALDEGRAQGRSEAAAEAEKRLHSFAQAVARGRAPEGLTPGSPEAALQSALEQGWSPRESEREAALAEAIGRVSAFLDKSVRSQLQGFDEREGRDELAERIERALGALQDLDFFIAETQGARDGANIATLAQRVSREFASDQGVGVRLQLASNSVRAVVNPAALMDALYLVLHNAGRFGGGSTVDLTVSDGDGRARIVVRDRGAGFSEEAFARAFDPFYSTSPDGLGLGLPHALKVIEGMGGRIDLRNVPDGGAEVEMSFPVG
jgi:signal transduction histidine kinase